MSARGLAASLPRTIAPHRTGFRTAAIAALAALLLAYLLLIWRRAWVCDDAYVTVRTVYNFLHGHGLRWNVAERVQAYTHPLWMLLLAAAASITHEFFRTSIFLGLATSLAAVLVLALGIARTLSQACLGVGLLVLSRSYVDYSTSGLENPLTHLLLGLFLYGTLRRDAPGPPNAWTFLPAGLLLCTRMDVGLLVLPALILLALQRPRRRSLFALLFGATPFWLWEFFSLLYYGFAIPNTAFAKLSTGLGTSPLLAQGSEYFANAARHDPLTPLAIAAGVVLSFVQRDRRLAALGLGIGLYLLYVLRIGGDFMSGRMFTPALFASVAILAHARLNARLTWLGLAGVALLACILPSSLRGGADIYAHGSPPQPILAVDDDGISDERAYYSYCAALAHAPRGVPWPDPESAAMAAQLRQSWRTDGFADKLKQLGLMSARDPWPQRALEMPLTALTPVGARGAIGFLGYYIGPGFHVLDFQALADPLLARLPAEKHDPILPELLPRIAARRGWRVGHYVRRIPEGYFATLSTGRNVIADPDLAAYWEQLSRVTRGPLLDPVRLRAIWELNSGQNDLFLRNYLARSKR